MARTRRRARRRYNFSRGYFRRPKKLTIPLAVVGGFVPTALGIWNNRSDATAMGAYLQRGWTGMEPGTGQFNIANLRLGALPALAGFLVHIVAGKMGVNRAIARAGIPLIRI